MQNLLTLLPMIKYAKGWVKSLIQLIPADLDMIHLEMESLLIKKYKKSICQIGNIDLM